MNFSRYWAAAFLLLMAASYRLWLPNTAFQTSSYPAIPLVDVPETISRMLSLGIPFVLVLSTLFILFARQVSHRSTGWMVLAVAIAASFVTDQHRLQPWAYQTFLYACLLALLPERPVIPFLRVLTIGIYTFSSLGKFDYQFLHTVGQEFLTTAAGFVGMDVTAWPVRDRLVAAAMFPVAEMSVAILLMFSKTRVVAGFFAIAMHASLIVLLSPLGMHHSFGVLVWNAVLAGQAYLLFIRKNQDFEKLPNAPENTLGSKSTRPRTIVSLWSKSIAIMFVLFALILPLTERRDQLGEDRWHWDHWLSWALYSPHNSRVSVEIHQNAVDDLPPSIRAAVAVDRNGDSWHELQLGILSLQQRGVPILPQARYQLGLAVAIARQAGLKDSIRAVIRSSSDRFDGSRRERWVMGLQEMKTLSP